MYGQVGYAARLVFYMNPGYHFLMEFSVPCWLAWTRDGTDGERQARRHLCEAVRWPAVTPRVNPQPCKFVRTPGNASWAIHYAMNALNNS